MTKKEFKEIDDLPDALVDQFEEVERRVRVAIQGANVHIIASVMGGLIAHIIASEPEKVGQNIKTFMLCLVENVRRLLEEQKLG